VVKRNSRNITYAADGTIRGQESYPAASRGGVAVTLTLVHTDLTLTDRNTLVDFCISTGDGIVTVSHHDGESYDGYIAGWQDQPLPGALWNVRVTLDATRQ
jgi:hypothetical protein